MGPHIISRGDAEIAHMHDVAVQDNFGAKHLKFWIKDKEGTAFSLIAARTREVSPERQNDKLLFSYLFRAN